MNIGGVINRLVGIIGEVCNEIDSLGEEYDNSRPNDRLTQQLERFTAVEASLWEAVAVLEAEQLKRLTEQAHTISY